MKTDSRPWPWLLLALAVLVVLVIQSRKDPRSRDGSGRRDASPGGSVELKQSFQSRGRNAGRTDVERFASAIQDAASALRDGQSAGDAAIALNRLGGVLGAGDPGAVSVAVRGFFASGDDASTGMPFAVAADGRLDSWPTLRTFLLEWLATADPEAALGLSREVMDRMTSPEEYAIALRNLGWADLDGDLAEEFDDRFERLLRMKEWRVQPGPAYLESMDAALLLPPGRAAGLLAEIQADGATPSHLARASFIALDRVAERDPAVLVGLETDRLGPDQRASLLSRLDVTEPAQRGRFVDYLASLPDGAELDYFASLFPNGNHLQGNRLFSTATRPPSIAERREKDRRILAELNAMDFPDGSPAASAVGRIAERLGTWLAAQE